MGTHKLTKDCLRTIMLGTHVPNPIVQVLLCRKVKTTHKDGRDRFRLLLSDGNNKFFLVIFLTAKNNPICAGDGTIPLHSVVKLTNYLAQQVDNNEHNISHILLVLEMEIVAVGSIVDGIIGSPVLLTGDTLRTLSNNANAFHTVNSSTNHTTSATSAIFNPIKPNGNCWCPITRQTDLDISLKRRGGLTDRIATLSPYNFDWIIKARVSHKSGIRFWSNSNGDGMLFSMDLVDESGEIRCVAFRRQVDQFYHLIHVDKLYYIAKCRITRANPRYNSMRNKYELIMEFDSEIKLVPNAVATSIPEIKYYFTKIDQIAHIEAGRLLDVIGVCHQAGDLIAFRSRYGQDFTKRIVLLVDQTDTVVALTLWSNEAEQFTHTDNPVVVVKGARVGDFGGGKNLSLLHGSQIRLNADIEECRCLREWYDSGGKSQDFQNISGYGNFQLPWRHFNEVDELILGQSVNGDYYQVIGTILHINSESILYKACISGNCNKKVVDLSDGTYRCEKCGTISSYFKYRLLAFMNVADCTGGQWVNMFNDDVEKVLGLTAAEVGKKCEENAGELSNVCRKALFKRFVMKCRTKTVTFNGETRSNTVVVHVEPIDYQKYNESVIKSISSLIQK